MTTFAYDLPNAARLYSSGDMTWHQVRELTGASFGELLVELAKQGLPLPQAVAVKTAAQQDLFNRALSLEEVLKRRSGIA